MPVPDGGKNLTICAFDYIQYHNVSGKQTDGFIETVLRSAVQHAEAREKLAH